MCYNMGQEKLEKYSEMNKAIKEMNNDVKEMNNGVKEMNNGFKKEKKTTWKQIADLVKKTDWCKKN